MFNKILVAIDTSAIGKNVFDEALSLAKAVQGSLMLLHVLSAEEQDSPTMPGISGIDFYPLLGNEILEMYHEEWEAFEKRGLELLRSRQNEATLAGVSAEFTQTPGSPGRIICDLARNWQADLIVIGRRGHSGLSELILGSVSNYVLHHAPCCVLTVQHLVTASAETAQAQQVSSVV